MNADERATKPTSTLDPHTLDEPGTASSTQPGGPPPGAKKKRAWVLWTVVGVILAILAAVVVFAWSKAAVNTAGQVAFERDLAIPTLAESEMVNGERVFNLDLQAGEVDLGQSAKTPTIGINGAFLGPTVRASRGEKVRFNVTNSLDEVSAVHWHGMHVPPAMDGGPHQAIEPGATWVANWTIDQPAATLWYHPHPHGNTASQAYRGLAGVFLIDDDNPVQQELPHEYGVDDVPVVVQDKRFNSDGTLSEDTPMFSNTGVRGSTILVNGTIGPKFEVTTERVRLRLLNGSGARVYNFGFPDNRAFDVISTDGGLLDKPVKTERLQLSPGDRADIVVEFTAGETVVLRSYAQNLGTNVFTARFSGGSDVMDVLQLNAAATLAASGPVPTTLAQAADALPADASKAVKTRTFDLSGSTINGKLMDMSRIDEVVYSGDTEIWKVTGTDDAPHNFHMHDVRFTVLDVGGKTPPLELQGPQDTVYLQPGKATRLLVQFNAAEETPDPEHPFMFHCHLLLHEDQGMMGQFVIARHGEKVNTTLDTNTSMSH